MRKIFAFTFGLICLFSAGNLIAQPLSSSKFSLPEPSGWYTGDIHVHRNCGDGTLTLEENQIAAMMDSNRLSVISLLADMGNGEVKISKEDLPKINGKDAGISTPDHIIHWDAEWHWDATYSNFDHQALGGHLVLLGLKEGHQIWDESPYKVLKWAKDQDAVTGICHMEYLNDSIQNELNCCIPIDYPVEAALGTIDFVAEDVFGIHSKKSKNYNSEAAINAYYKLLNCGMKLGLAAGTDYPCNNLEPFGTLLTYVNVKDKNLTYRKWIQGIKDGRTVVSRDGHNEFIELIVNQKFQPGDEIKLKKNGLVTMQVKWTSIKEGNGRIELVSNGKIIAVQEGKSIPGKPVILKFSQPFSKSGWIAARRMNDEGHVTHTAPVYINVDDKPVRASSNDAQFFISWIDNILEKTAPGGVWSKYFSHDQEIVRKRYQQAKDIYTKIKAESEENSVTNGNQYPILILSTADNYGLYTGEILKLEGFNDFTIDSFSNKASLSYLKKFPVIILPKATITDAQQKMISAYVKDGGKIIAFNPDKKLDNVFGITHSGNQSGSKYFAINTKTPIGKGLISQSMQLHDSAENYTLKTASSVASLYGAQSQAASYPAVAFNKFGAGQAIAFAFNLPRNIQLTRQGNYKNAGEEHDGILGIRAMDLFTDGWVDTSKNLLNQADEQMRLLSHCIENLADHSPLPRFWYFPDTLKSLVVFTNDGEHSSEAEFEPQFRDLESKDARMSLYILDNKKTSKASVDSWISRGHEISGHTDDTREAENPHWDTMNASINYKRNELMADYGIDKMRTIVNHWFVWVGKNNKGEKDFTAQARLEAMNGMEMDINYAHYDNKSSQPRFLGPLGINQGNYTGTGLPLKFADESGSLINLYHLFNSVYDQQYTENHDSIGFFNCFKGLLDRSLDNEIYSYVTMKAHNDEYFFTKRPVMQMLDYAKLKKVPVWAPVKLLDFLIAKDQASFSDIRYSSNGMKFKINSPVKNENAISTMVPSGYRGKRIDNIYVDGQKQSYIIRKIKGQTYALFSFRPGSQHLVSINYK